MSTKRGLLAVLLASAVVLVLGFGPQRAGLAQDRVPPAAWPREPAPIPHGDSSPTPAP